MSWARGTSIAMGRDKHHPRPPSCQADRYVVRGPWRVVTSSHVSTPLPHSPFPGLWTDERIRAAYSEGAGIYRIVPAGVAIPRGVEDLQQLVRWAAETGTPLVARGGGSGMAGGSVGRGGIVDLSRSEEHTSELQSPCNLVCRLLLEKKKKQCHSLHLKPFAREFHSLISPRPETRK